MAATAPRAAAGTRAADRADMAFPLSTLASGIDTAAATRTPGDAIRRLMIAAAGTAPVQRLRLPLAMADVVAVLWTRLLKFDAADPVWPDRDRFVLPDGLGADMLYALLQLTGHAVAASDTPPGAWLAAAQRPPEHALPSAVAALNGPNGQGLAIAIGLALAERMLAARFGRSLADHRTWVVAGEPDLAGGLSHEAICLAGELRLGRLAILYDAGQAPTGDLAKRFHAAGWAVRDSDGHDPIAIGGALSFAQRSRRPTLICCRTDGPDPDALDALARAGVPINDETARHWAVAGRRGAAARRAWLKRLAQHPLRSEFERALTGRRADEWRDAIAALQSEKDRVDGFDTRCAGQRILDELMNAVSELLQCTAGTAAPAAPASLLPAAECYRARRLWFGQREHGMAAAMNGIALHGGWLPAGRSRASASDSLRSAIRLAGLMRQPVIHVLTHDAAGADGQDPAQQIAEHLASLRAIPDVLVFRPADATETQECWELALRRADGPSVIFLSGNPMPTLPRCVPGNQSARGAYLLVDPVPRRAATLIAAGPDVMLALRARAALAGEGYAVAVVSLPCWELFAAQDEAYRATVLGNAPRIGIEASPGFGWERWLGSGGRFIGLPGANNKGGDLYNGVGITPDAVIDAVRSVAARS